MGDRYGPILVARDALGPKDIRGKRIAVPGPMTTAFLALKLFEPDFVAEFMQFDQIMAAVRQGSVDLGLLIHEGQLTYTKSGLHKVMDMGEWWYNQTGLPLPLGGNGIRRDLGMDHIREISRLIKTSIQYSLDHREDALRHALQYARGLDAGDADRFVSMYVNRRTLDYGEDGRMAVQRLLDEAHSKQLIPKRIQAEFAPGR